MCLGFLSNHAFDGDDERQNAEAESLAAVLHGIPSDRF